jgi:hypothetical protein
VGQQPGELPSQKSSYRKQDFFDVYKVAINDLHHMKSLGQRIDSFYLTIITLLLTADAYEIGTSKFDSWVPVVATAGVAIIGVAVTARWLQGAANLYQLTNYRYSWLRKLENPDTRPEMREISVNIFTDEYKDVYLPQMTKKGKAKTSTSQDLTQAEPRTSKFYRRTLFLQRLCLVLFPAVPIILAGVTFLMLNSSVLQPIISGK